MADQENSWSLHISPDGMSADVVVRGESGINPESLSAEIRAAGVCYGMDPGAIKQAVTDRGTSVTVARGQPPLPGQDAMLKFHVEEQWLTGEASATIRQDLRQQVLVPSVEKGQLLAEVIPSTPGTPGTDVYGNPVQPSCPLEITLRALKGTSLSADGKHISSTITGRPRAEIQKKHASFQVLPNFVHRGDVTVQVGHLEFQGDITIMGNVTEGTAVTATGSVEVYGNAIGARITAGQQVSVSGNVIQTRILAGTDRLMCKEALPVLDKFVSYFAELVDILGQLSADVKFNRLPFSHVIWQVINTRFPTWEEERQSLQNFFRQNKTKSPGQTGELNSYVQVIDRLDVTCWQDRTSLSDAASGVLNLRKEMLGDEADGGDIKLAYSLNSELRAGRKIFVKGQGCMRSRLEACEEIRIQGKLRGGSVTAGNYIYVQEVGSDAGAGTVLQVSGSGRIDSDRSFENTVFLVGKNMLKVTETTGLTRTAFDSDARLILLPRR